MKTEIRGSWKAMLILAALPFVAATLQTPEPGDASTNNPPAATNTVAPQTTVASNSAPADAAVAVIVTNVPPAPPAVNLSKGIAEVVRLAQSGVDEGVLLAYIGSVNSQFNVGSDQILYLNDIGISSNAIKAMMDRDVAIDWLKRFEGAGLDGVIAKPAAATYQPGKRAMFKIKHVRSADCVLAGFRWHKSGKDRVGSLLLGLYDDEGTLQHVGVTSAFTMETRKQLVKEFKPLRKNALEKHPWRAWAGAEAQSSRMPGGQSRWSAGKDLSWEPLRIERVCEVKYDHMEGDRFRHPPVFLRWRHDKKPKDCRYDQLEVTPAYELAKVFGA